MTYLLSNNRCFARNINYLLVTNWIKRNQYIEEGEVNSENIQKHQVSTLRFLLW